MFQRSKPDKTSEEVRIQDVKVNYRQVPSEFLRNTHLPIDPLIEERIKKEKEDEDRRWIVPFISS